jgi:hypothetical protein
MSDDTLRQMDAEQHAKAKGGAVDVLAAYFDGKAGTADAILALAAVAELIAAATASLEQTKQNQRDGLVPTIYYPAHKRLASALALVGGAK